MNAGKKYWALSAGHIPLRSTGEEPEFTSRDQISILNASGRDAEIKISIFYQDRNPVADYCITVKASRVRKIRINDLIDPMPVPLDEPFACEILSSENVIVQFLRVDTRSENVTGFICTPFY